MKSFLCLLSVLVLTGCAAFQRPDGTTDPAKVEAAGAQAQAVGSMLGFPWGLVGTGIAGVLGAYAMHLRGQNVGWDQAKGTPAKPPQT